MMMVRFTIKAGQSFAVGFRVVGLDPAATWTPRCEVRNSCSYALVGVIQGALSDAPDFATTGARLLALTADPVETAKWLSPCELEQLHISDVVFTSSAGAVIPSSTFEILVQKRVTE